MTGFKEKIIIECKKHLDVKKASLLGSLEEINESLTSETKSSAGDKHETARSKMQFEQGKLNSQLAELNDLVNELEKINPQAIAETIFTGTVVETNNGTFFIAVPLGKIKIEEREVYVISAQSPIGKLMMGLRQHDTFSVNDIHYRIEKYY
jgi:transcription elongation GreA/GreB family factor